MQGRNHTAQPLLALRMAVCRRKPKAKVHLHSDQGSLFTSDAWQAFLEQYNLAPSMSRRWNRWDSAVVQSVFSLLKRERIRRKKYRTRKEPRHDVFDDIHFSTTRSVNKLGMVYRHQSPSHSRRN